MKVKELSFGTINIDGKNYFNHLKETGRLFYLYTALRIIRSEGKDWEGDAPSVNAVLDHVLNLIA